MMIKITESCSMGCSHCMNNARPCDNHMAENVFRDALAFCAANAYGMCLITGGEPTEHPDFQKFLEIALSTPGIVHVTVTTNGVWMQSQYDYVEKMEQQFPGAKLMWQVTSDKRFYPIQIDLDLPVFKLSSVVVCTEIERIYPQGRAKANNIPYQANGSKCFNIRALATQLKTRNILLQRELSVEEICKTLMSRQLFCVPDIGVNGEIRLGESDLCPICSSIYKTDEQIINDILNFRCHQCEFINRNLPPLYRALIGEP